MHLIDVLRKNAPAPADDGYRRGAERATGGALRADGDSELIDRPGFGPKRKVRA